MFLSTFLQWSWPLSAKGHELHLQVHIWSFVWKNRRTCVFLPCGTFRQQCRQGHAPQGWCLQQMLTAEEQLIFQGSALHHRTMGVHLSPFLLSLIYLEIGYQVTAGTESGGFQRNCMLGSITPFHQNNRKDKGQHCFLFCYFLALDWEAVTQLYPFPFSTLRGLDGMGSQQCAATREYEPGALQRCGKDILGLLKLVRWQPCVFRNAKSHALCVSCDR